MVKLTQRQADVLAFIKEYIEENGYSPSNSDIGKEFSILTNAAFCHVRALVKRGAVTKVEGVPRSMVPVEGFKVVIK
jgi:repressor LexA